MSKTGMVVLDNSNLDAIVADSQPQETELPIATATNPNGSKSATLETPKNDVKAEPKVEAKTEPDDETEGEDGLTDKQRAEWTASMKKTIGKKHRQAKEAEEFAQAQYNEKIMAQRRVEELERQLRRYTPQEAAQPSGPPDRNNFETDAAYNEAMVDYKVELKLAEQEAKLQQQYAQQQQQQVLASAEARIAKARDIVPDFDETLESVEEPVPPAVANYMLESELFAELGYYLAKNPAELEKLQQLPPQKQLVAIGKIEAILKPFEPDSKGHNGTTPSSEGQRETAKPVTNGKPSKAPTPITPLNTASGTQVEKDESEMTYLEARQKWTTQNRSNLLKRPRH